MLCKHGGQLFGAIVAVVEEYHHMAGTDASVDGIVDNRLDEFVGHSLGIAFLHGPDHVVTLAALAVDEHIVCEFEALPALVAVHGIIAADDRCDFSGASGAVLPHFGEEAGAAPGVGVTAVHEAVQIHLVETIRFRGVAEGVEMIER